MAHGLCRFVYFTQRREPCEPNPELPFELQVERHAEFQRPSAVITPSDPGLPGTEPPAQLEQDSACHFRQHSMGAARWQPPLLTIASLRGSFNEASSYVVQNQYVLYCQLTFREDDSTKKHRYTKYANRTECHFTPRGIIVRPPNAVVVCVS